MMMFLKLAVRRFNTSVQINHPILNYQNFFREIQKAAKVDQAISVYTSYINQGVQHHKYIATTLRILTRLIKNSQQHQLLVISNFLKNKMVDIKTIKIDSMDIEQFKDMLIFFLQYSNSNNQLNLEERALIQTYLNKFIAFFKASSLQVKQKYLPVLSTSLKMVSQYYKYHFAQFAEAILSVIKGNSKLIICDNLTFINIVKMVKDVYDPSSRDSRQFVINIIELISQSNPLTIFQQNALANIYLMLYSIKDKGQLLKTQINKILGLLTVIEDYLCTKIISFSQRDLQVLIPSLLRDHKQSKFLKLYFQILGLSILPSGETCIHPWISVHYLNLFSNRELYLLKNNSKEWQYHFVKFVQIYFHRQNQFKMDISKKIHHIVTNKLFRQENTLKMYAFYIDECNNNYQNINDYIKTQISNAVIHGEMLSFDKQAEALLMVEQQLKKIEKYRQQINQTTFNWLSMSKFNKILDRNHIMLFLKASMAKQLGLNQSQKLINETALFIIQMQIKLLYLNGKSKYFQQLLLPTTTTIANLFPQKQELVKQLIFFTKIEPNHYQQLFKWLVQFYNNSYQELQYIIYKVILQLGNDLTYDFDYYTVSILCQFYLSHIPNSYHKLIFHDKLFQKMALFRTKEVIDYIFKIVKLRPNYSIKYLSIFQRILFVAYKWHFNSELSLLILNYILDLPRSQSCQLFQNMAEFAYVNCLADKNNIDKVLTNYLNDSSQQQLAKIQINTLSRIRKEVAGQLTGKYQLMQTIVQMHQLTNKLKVKAAVDQLSKTQQCIDQESKQLSHLQLTISMNFMRKLAQIKYPFTSNNHFVNTVAMQLIQMGQKDECSQYLKYQIIKLIITNNIFSSKQNSIQQFNSLQTATELAPHEWLELAAVFPSIKEEWLLFNNAEHFAVNNTPQNINSFLLIYALIETPSARITDFMLKLIKSHKTTLPLFFIVYLKQFHSAIYKTIKIEETSGLLLFDLKDEKTVHISDATCKLLFANNQRCLVNFYDISRQNIRQNCGKLIINKIAKSMYPQKQLIYDQVQQKKKFFVNKNKQQSRP